MEFEKRKPRFTLITQNVDGLHDRAGSGVALGPVHPTEERASRRPEPERRGGHGAFLGPKADGTFPVYGPNRAERWFQRWGNFGVLVGRVTPIVRSFVSIPAGVFEMPLAPYTLYTVVGSAVWSFVIAGVGYGLGSSYERFNHGFKYAEYAVVAGVLVLAAYLIYRLRRAATVRRRDDPAR